MSRKSVIGTVVLGALALALLGWLVLQETDDSVSGSNRSTSSKPKSEVEANSAAPTIDGPLRSVPFQPGEETKPESETAAPATHFALLVDEADQPVPGAELKVLRAGRRNGGFPGGGEEPAVVLRTVKSGTDGLAPLNPTPRRSLRLEARTKTHSGFVEYRPDVAPDTNLQLAEGVLAVVVLKPIRTLEVQVLDPSGAPVPHILLQARDAETAAEPGWGRGGRGNFGRRASSLEAISLEPDGTAHFEITTAHDEAYTAMALLVTASLPGLESTSLRVELLETGSTRATLRIPPTLTYALTLKDARGEVAKDPIQLSWFPAEMSGRGNDRNNYFFANFERLSLNGNRTVQGGKVLLGGFSPDEAFRFSATSENRMTTSAIIEPPHKITRYEVDFLVGEAPPILIVQLVDSTKKPVPDLSLQARIVYDDVEGLPFNERTSEAGFGARSRTVTTDESGRITVSARDARKGRVELSTSGRQGFRRRGENEGSAQRDLLASLAFPVLVAGETRDLGTADIPDKAVVASGRVIDSQERPIPSIRVTVRSAATEEPNREFQSFVEPISAETDAEGRFRVFGEEHEGPLSISAQDRSVRSDSQIIKFGATDLVLRGVATGGLSGRVRVEDPTINLRPEISVRRSGESGAGRDRRGGQAVNIAADGTFIVRGLYPGTYDLTIRLSGELAFEASGLTVPEGILAKPTVLQDVVVGREFVMAEVAVRGGDGHPLRGAQVTFRSQGAAPEEARPPGFGGRASGSQTNDLGKIQRLLRRGVQTQVTVTHPEHLPITVDQPVFPLELRMRASPALTVTFSQALPTLSGVENLSLVLVPAGRGDREANARRWPAGGRESRTTSLVPGVNAATFPHVDPGTYSVQLSFRRSSQRGASSGFNFDRMTVPLGTLAVPSSSESAALIVPLMIDSVTVLSAFEAQLKVGR